MNIYLLIFSCHGTFRCQEQSKTINPFAILLYCSNDVKYILRIEQKLGNGNSLIGYHYWMGSCKSLIIVLSTCALLGHKRRAFFVRTLCWMVLSKKYSPNLCKTRQVLFSLLDFSHIYDCVVGVGSAICEKCYHEGDHHKHEFGNSKTLGFSCLESHSSSKFITIALNHLLKNRM